MSQQLDDTLASAVPGFQPIIDVARNRIVGYEALARRRHPESGALDSLGHLFYGGQIPSRDLLTLDRHIRQQAIARMPELSEGFLSLNISPDWINQLTAWASTPLLSMLSSAGVDPANVVLEITEQKGSIEALKRVVKRYREEGYRVAIDDFGAGSSHMHRIMELEPDILKLDMQLFKNAANGGQHHDLVHSVSRLAEKTGCQLVCEGVETEQEFHFGLSLGAAWMQGFLFSAAQADFQQATAYQRSISSLRQQFLQQRLASEKAYNRFAQDVLTVLRNLKQQCLNADDLNQVKLPANTPVLKFYLCDGSGTQISPNYEQHSGHLVINPEPQGVNWCWRPHFYRLLAVKQTMETEFTASNQYRDVSSRQLCRSYVTRLNSTQYLLVDVRQPDHDPGVAGVNTN